MKKVAVLLLVSSSLLAGSAIAQDHTTKYDGQWRSSKMIGVNVYNSANEKLGDINELILDKAGKVESVVIGVGGFLGMGEHDVAVTFDKLKFVNEPLRSASGNTDDARKDGNRTTGTATRSDALAPNWYPDHAVLDANKDQLKSMPEFKYSNYK